MKFMGDLPLKGQSELDVVYALLKVICFPALDCIKPCGAGDGRAPGFDGVLFSVQGVQLKGEGTLSQVKSSCNSSEFSESRYSAAKFV